VIEELINHNLEREEKERLLRVKVTELKELFKNSTLNDLRGLSIILDNEDENDDVEKLLEDEE
jgi:hypothetical protein